MKIKCQINGHTCVLPTYLTQSLMRASFLYCSTINQNGKPQIQPLIFVNERGTCNIVFLIKKQSDLARNLQKNPKLALTIDETHPTDPLQNKGILIEAVSQQNDTEDEVEKCFNYLQKKYDSDIVTKILGIDIISNYAKMVAFPIKIVYWKGPFFKKFKCNQR